MNKLELISALKKEADISKSEAAKIVQIFFDSMSDALIKAERIEIRGLCRWDSRGAVRSVECFDSAYKFDR